MCACTGMGLKAAWSLRCERRLWRAWVLLLQRMHTTLRYTASPIQEVLRTVDKTELDALSWLSEYEHEGETLVLPRALDERERAFAMSFFAPLGTTDLEGQLMHIEQHIDRAEQAQADACAVYKRCAKAYVMTGVCVGLCIGLALI